MINYVDLCYRFFGNISRNIKPYFLDVREDMQKANLSYTLDEYLATALFTSTITFVAECILLSIIFALLLENAFIGIFLGLTLSFTISGIIFFLFYSYPSAVGKSREAKIKKGLPFSVSYMATVSSAKLPPIEIFHTLSRFKEYNELAEEANSIVKDVEIFGLPFSTAVKRHAKKTSSDELKDILWGINTVIASGGDLTLFLKQKGDNLMDEYRRSIRKYSQDLSLFVEIYLTLIITGAIFFIVLSSVISSMSAGMDTIAVQGFVVFILLPLLSLGFLVILKFISPLE